MTPLPSPRILLVEDHVLVRQMLARFLGEQLQLEVCGECSTAAEAARLVGELRPELVLLDWTLPDGTAPDLLARFNAPAPRCIVLTSQEQPAVARAAAELGVAAFVLKRSGSDALCEAVRQALAGETYFCAASAVLLARAIREASAPAGDLTARELEVLRAIAAGRSPKEIAADLGTSPKTIYNQIAALKTKLGLTETAGLVRYALERGLAGESS